MAYVHVIKTKSNSKVDVEAMLYISELTGMLPSKYEQLVNGAVILERKYILRRKGRDEKWQNWK